MFVESNSDNDSDSDSDNDMMMMMMMMMMIMIKIMRPMFVFSDNGDRVPQYCDNSLFTFHHQIETDGIDVCIFLVQKIDSCKGLGCKSLARGYLSRDLGLRNF